MPEALAQDTAPIGAGPFQFSAQDDEDHLELLPFAGYYQGKPKISRLRIRTVRDETTRVLELLKGRADLMIGGAMSPASLPSLAENPSLRVLKRPGTGYAYLAFNLRQPPFSDARVRRAICHAIDAALITRTKFHGLAEPAAGMLPSTHWAYAPTAGCQPNAAAAAKLLEEAGYAAPNRPLQFTLKTSNDRFRKSIALIFKEQLSQLGIVVELRSLEFGTFFSDVRKGNFDAITLKWSAVIEPDLLRDVFASRNIPSALNHFSGWNRGAYVDRRLDEVLEQAAGTLVLGERRAFYRKAQDILDRDLPYIPLWHEDAVAIVSSHLQDFEPSTHNFFRPLATAREVSR
jgi:peptide/nickel transport system substrate-binding protein